MSDFFTMQGYGAYIWSAYGLAFIVLGTLAVVSRRELARARRRLSQLEQAKASPNP